MADVDPVVAAAAPHRPVAGGEDDRLALLRGHHFTFGLRPGPLLHQQELAPGVVPPRLAEEAGYLQRESDFSVNVLVQAVVAALGIAQQKRSRPALAMAVADLEKFVEPPG